MAESPLETEDEVVAPKASPGKTWKQWIPLFAAITLTPIISYGVTQYILIPRIKTAIGTQPPIATGRGGTKTAAHAGSTEGNKTAVGNFSYPFDNIVVNLAGAKGTRYLKASFTVVSTNPDLKDIITQHRIELLDLTISILSAKSLVDLEVPGAKNVLRHDLLENFNQNLKANVIEQLYFSEFVIQ